MDRSYRLKMEELLSTNVLTREYLLNCVAKDEKKINDIAYKKKQYESSKVNVYKSKFDELIEYSKPFIDVLMSEYRMSLDDIKTELQNVKEKNIPTKEVCNRIREIIMRCLASAREPRMTKSRRHTASWQESTILI